MGKKYNWREALSVKKILILVEGLTEEKFVTDLLSPYFIQQKLYIIPKIIDTRIVPGGKNYKGGFVKYSVLKRELQNLLGDSSAVSVTTMIDYYKFPGNIFLEEKSQKFTNPYDRVSYIEHKFSEDINHSRFIPYLQLHEFEACLFSSSKGFSKGLIAGESDIKKIEKIIAHFNNSPEEINDDETTAPSKRIKSIFPDYEKVSDGPVIAGYIGIDEIRKKCLHFNEWIRKLEAIS